MKRSAHSRYATTPLRPDGLLAMWEAPSFPATSDDRTHRVAPGEEGRLDVIAAAYYGDAALAWVIARANKIRHIQRDVTLGRTLRIPSDAAVRKVRDGTLRG